MEESPWHFMGKLFLVKEWNRTLSLEEVDMTRIAFWVQVHNLPLEYMTAANVPQIGNQLGHIISFEDSE